ncbi:hypothetical protein AAVH_20837 [Aphelenchoides avenae]|nr:hypothetical protein AAVH_20837 [Aphelenchus avenae]
MRLLLAVFFLLGAILLVIAQEVPEQPVEQRLIDSTDFRPQFEGAPPEPAPGNEISIQTVATEAHAGESTTASSSSTKNHGHKLVRPRPKPLSGKRRLHLKKLLAKRKPFKRTTQPHTATSSVGRPSP